MDQHFWSVSRARVDAMHGFAIVLGSVGLAKETKISENQAASLTQLGSAAQVEPALAHELVVALARTRPSTSLGGYLLGLIKQPLEDEACAAYHVMASLGRHNFGLRVLWETEGLIDAVLDRRGMFDGLIVEWKFKVVKDVVEQNPSFQQGSTEAVLPQEVESKVRAYYKQGRYYTKMEHKVAEPVDMVRR